MAFMEKLNVYWTYGMAAHFVCRIFCVHSCYV